MGDATRGNHGGLNFGDADSTTTDAIILMELVRGAFHDGRAARFFWSREGSIIIFILAAIGLASIISQTISLTVLIRTKSSIISALHPPIRSVQHSCSRGTAALIIPLLFVQQAKAIQSLISKICHTAFVWGMAGKSIDKTGNLNACPRYNRVPCNLRGLSGRVRWERPRPMLPSLKPTF